MKLKDIVKLEGFEVVVDGDFDTEVSGGYMGDLLSVVMGNLEEGQLWITIQSHVNIVAVASLRGASAIVIAHGFSPDEETIASAKEEGIVILKTSLAPFEAVKKLVKEVGL